VELQAKDVSEQAKDALAQMQSSPSSVGPINSAIDEITSVTETAVSFTNTWDPLLKKIELFTKIVDGIAEVRHKCDWILHIPILILWKGSPLCQNGMVSFVCRPQSAFQLHIE